MIKKWFIIRSKAERDENRHSESESGSASDEDDDNNGEKDSSVDEEDEEDNDSESPEAGSDASDDEDMDEDDDDDDDEEENGTRLFIHNKCCDSGYFLFICLLWGLFLSLFLSSQEKEKETEEFSPFRCQRGKDDIYQVGTTKDLE